MCPPPPPPPEAEIGRKWYINKLHFSTLPPSPDGSTCSEKKWVSRCVRYLIKAQSDVCLLGHTSLQYAQDFQTQRFVTGTVVLTVEVHWDLSVETSRALSH